jgi:hydrogenase nickel incorporation protein HypA/HybF
MHEYSIVQSLFESVVALAEENDASTVTSVYLKIGELSGVEPELLATAFDQFRAATIMSDATLHIEPVAAAWACPKCRARIRRGERLRCATCNTPASLTAGDEIILERVEMEAAHV